jgi:hypothetical protein
MNDKEIKHIIVVRMKYSDNDKFIERDNIRELTFIPSILNQINKNFKIAFIINPQHQDIINKYFKNKNFDILFFNNSDEVREYCITNNFNIQTRIDDDDIFSVEYVDIIQKMFIQKINLHGKFLIQSQPYKFLMENNEYYKMGLRYNNKLTSMFLTLCQSNVDSFIMDKPHNKMHEIVDDVFLTDEGICSLVIHGSNNVSNLKKYDKSIDVTDLSIIIPTFNNVEYIDECLMSIIDSSKNFNFEILVGIDNCEKTLDYIKKYGDKYFNTKFYLFKDSVGPYVIKNTLTQISNSNNIIFFDSDDIMLPECAPTVMENSEQCGSIRFKFNNFIDLNEPYENKGHAEGVFYIKKSYFNYLNGFEPWKCAADSEFHYRVIKNNIKTKYLKNISFLRRIHKISLTNSVITGFKSNIRSIYSKIIKEKQRTSNIGPLTEMIVHSFYHIDDDEIRLISDKTNFKYFNELNIYDKKDEEPVENINEYKINLSSVLPFNFNPGKEINYEVINNRMGVKIPSSVKERSIPINKPKDRNELNKIKQDSMVNLNLEFGNIRNKKKNRNSGIF